MVERTNAKKEFEYIINLYSKIAPKWTFPYIGFIIAGSIVFLGWFGGRILFPTYSLIPRILLSWTIALFEYIFLIITIGASVEVLNIPESTLAILIHAAQLGMFFLLNMLILKSEFTMKHGFAFILMIAAIFLVAF